MEIQIIKDIDGKEHIVLNNESLLNDSYSGDTINDFETMKIIGRGNKSLTLKVKSKINAKIYVMKKINQKLSLMERENLFQIINRIRSNESPNIIKNIKSIYQNNGFIILDEYMNNGDLLDYMKSNKELNKPIDEKILWNIFLQCASSIKDIHMLNIIHRNVKLENFMINQKKVVKLGNFTKAIISNGDNVVMNKGNEYLGGYLYQSPEMLNNKGFTKKTDIFSLGVVFHKLCYYSYPFIINRTKDGYVLKPNENKENLNVYSEEMRNIINLMLNEEEKNRPDSNNLYERILLEFVKYYDKNSSIEAVFRCINSFKNFSNEIISYKQGFNNNETPISFNLINCLEDFNKNKDKKKCEVYLYNFRNLFDKNNSIDNSKEIRPERVLDYLIEKVNKEAQNNPNNTTSFITQPIKFDFNKKHSKDDILSFCKSNFSSLIYKYFIGFLKTKRICQNKRKNKCETYAYSVFPYIEFQLDRCLNDKTFEYEPNIKNWFIIQINHNHVLTKNHNIFCPKCKCVALHNEFKHLDTFPKYLIIVLNRGDAYRNTSKVIFPLDLKIVEVKAMNEIYEKEFNLVGIIKRMEEQNREYFISINYDSDKAKWILSDGKSLKEIDDPLTHEEGLVVILFYSKIN